MNKILLKGSMLSLVLALILVSGFAFAQADFKDGEPFGESLGAALAWPPLGPFLEIRIDGRENHNAAVAYNSKHDEYLVVWEEEIHGGEYAIFGRRLDSAGANIGPAFPIQHFTNFT